MQETLINPEIALLYRQIGSLDGKTAINPSVARLLSELRPVLGTTLEGGYTVIETMKSEGGEGDLFLCEKEGKRYVAKVYRRENAVKESVLEALRAIDSPHVVKVLSSGRYHGFPFEILPYFERGSLQGKRFSYEEIKTMILPAVNEALHALHERGVLHKDVKPSNLMLTDDGTVALIDFGISSVVGENATVLITKTGMTPEYSAPETFRKVFLKESDYYALGITLYELFAGHTPYRHLSPEAITQYMALQRIPFPEDMPSELCELISALTYHDLTARGERENPNRRWTYDEVAAFLRGEKQTLPGKGRGGLLSDDIKPYRFEGEIYTTLPTLVRALGEKWEQGKRELFYGRLSAHFEDDRPILARYCREIEEESLRLARRDDYLFWKLLYRLYPELTGVYWQGAVYESFSALGRDMLERLSLGKGRDKLWDGMLKERLLSESLSRLATPKPKLYEAIVALEEAASIDSTPRNQQVRFYLMAYLLSGKRQLTVDNKQFFTVEELVAEAKRRADESVDALKRFCRKLVGQELTPTPQLEAWLIAIGKADILAEWQQSLAE